MKADDFKLPEGASEIATGGEFKKWEKPGDSITGKILKLELSKKYRGENYIAILRTDDGKRVAVSAPLKLRLAIEENELAGKRVAIIYVGETPTKGDKAVSEFKIGVLPAQQDDEEDLPY